MISPEQFVLLTSFLKGLAQKCIVAAIKKHKEGTDQAAKQETTSAIHDIEAAKSVATKVEQRITASFRAKGINLQEHQIQSLLALETNPTLKEELATRFAASNISAEAIVDLLQNASPELDSARQELLALSQNWLDLIDKAIAEDPSLSRILNLRATRLIREQLDSMGNRLARSEVRNQDRHDQLFSMMSAIYHQLPINIDNNVLSTVPEHLKDQNQRRFDRARNHLIEGSIVVAETEHRSLIEDLERPESATNPELLQRTYMNLAACLFEQGKHAESALWLDKASLIEPKAWRAVRSAAMALIARGDRKGAIPLLRTVRELNPDDPDHVCNEAWALKNLGRINEALTLLGAREFSTSGYFATLSLTHLAADRPNEAETAARKALSLDANCPIAQSALAYALGIPIINHRQRRESLQIDPTIEERARLKEAIAIGEQAAIKLRQTHHIYSLAELVANLSPMCAAIVELDKATQYAQEALVLNPNDETSLTNLWCIQMRKGEFDNAVNTATRCHSIVDTVESWERRSEALLAADRAQEVITDWNELENQPLFAASIDAQILVARALSDRNRTEDGINLLNMLLAKNPNHCGTLSIRGLLYERLGKYSEAEQDLTAAEKNAPASEIVQALVNCAMFFKRRGQWHKSSERFAKVGATSIYNPLFTSYLTCIFNQSDYRQSVTLAEAAIGEKRRFVEDHYAIGARSHQLCGNLPRAKVLLEELVARNTSNDYEHRKQLGWIYWRLDELPQAYDVLLRGLERCPCDADFLILLSAVCTFLGRHLDSIDFACRAVKACPEHLPSRLALVRAAFSCPQNLQLKQDHLDAHFESLRFLQQHESGLVQRVPIDEDLHSILELVRNRSGAVRQFENQYRERRLPMSFFGRGVGASMYGLWSALLRHPRLQIRFAFGTMAEQQIEQEAAGQCESICVDPFALFTLQHLDLIDLLPKMFKSIFVYSGCLESLISDLRELRLNPEQTSLCYDDGKFFHGTRTLEQGVSAGDFLNRIISFLKSSNATLVGLLPEAAQHETAKVMLQTCGVDAVAPMLIAKEHSVTLFSDDAVIRSVARLDSNTPGFCTQAFLRVATARGFLSSSEYQDAVIKLIDGNYTFVSEDPGTIRRVYDLAGGKITPLAVSIINRVNDANYNGRSCLALLADFSVEIWRTAPPDGGASREAWLTSIWAAIARSTDGADLAIEFQAKLAVSSLLHPAVFVGIVTFAIRHIETLRYQRSTMYKVMQEAIAAITRLVELRYPFFPHLGREWRQHGRINRILWQRGWLPGDSPRRAY